MQTRARLVEAAKKVFERDGFLEARIVDIAEAANLAPGGFYHYFDSKEELFLEVAQMQEERLTAPSDGPVWRACGDLADGEHPSGQSPVPRALPGRGCPHGCH